MLTHIALLVAGLLAFPGSWQADLSSSVLPPATAYIGDPPSIRIAGKAAGPITHAEWGRVEKVELAGCEASALIVEVAVWIKDRTGKNTGVSAKGDRLTSAMLSMVANLPPGTPFTITAKVIGADKQELEVPAAHYLWKG